MGILTKIGGFFVGGGAKTMLDSAGGILSKIDGLSTSVEEKAKLRAAVVESYVSAQATTIKAEAEAGGISAKWRPYLMLSFGAIVIAHYVLFPMIAIAFPATAPVVGAMVLHPEMWVLLKLGIGGYIGGRSIEKIVDKVVPNMKLAKMKKKLLKKFTPKEISEMFEDNDG